MAEESVELGMSNVTRRQFLQWTAAVGTTGFPLTGRGSSGRVVVIGGGVGGITAAKSIKKAAPSLNVILVEQKKHYSACFMSNEVLAHSRSLESLRFTYDGLWKYGITVVNQSAVAIDAAVHKVILEGGAVLEYDRLIVSPGIDLRYDVIVGYNRRVAEKLPHAWTSGDQIGLLRTQLEAMQDGGTVLIAAPKNPFRCPSAPYERASQIAWYLQRYKPKSKIILLDAKEIFSQQALFMEAWRALYGFGTQNSLIDWHPASEEGTVTRVDPDAMAVYSGELDTVTKGAVINLIPPQMAGMIARTSGLTDDTYWCPVNKTTFESTKAKDVHILGDACNAQDMPKSAYSAASQAQCVAAVVVSAMSGVGEIPLFTHLNACYSILGQDWAISTVGVYRSNSTGTILQSVEGSGGTSSPGAGATKRNHAVEYAHSWYQNITHALFT